MFGCWGWRHDPGPCPVDDTPHTACTPESVAAKLAVQVRAQRPRSLDQTLAYYQRDQAPGVSPADIVAPAPAVDVPEADVSFSTKTYRRAVHGKRLRGTRARN